jgi:peptidoglycan hydrolase-like protein with peptidoglycan-binding domain
MEERPSTMRLMHMHRIASTVLALAMVALGMVMTPATGASAASPTCTGASGVIGTGGVAVNVPSIGNDTGNINCLLGVGNSGSAVALLQFHINACNGLSIARDGIFGPQTRTAVEIIQRIHQIAVDGVYGPQTREHMLWLDSSGNCVLVL